MTAKPIVAPCAGCLLIPVCRHKSYNRLMIECSDVQKYCAMEYQDSTLPFTIRIGNIEKLIKPSRWSWM
jgi:hypothetical protein